MITPCEAPKWPQDGLILGINSSPAPDSFLIKPNCRSVSGVDRVEAMKLLSVRKLINTAVFGIVAIQLVAMIDVQHQLQILNRVSPLLPLMSALGLIVLWVCLRKFSKNERRIHARNLQLQQECLALNVHALVLMTDSAGVMAHVNDNVLDKT